MIKIKRIYDEFEDSDGFRILTDRLWPRGFTKEKGKIDLWAKDISPSDKLRKWFNHDVSKWNLFRKNYLEELRNNDQFEGFSKIILKNKDKGNITLLFGAKDTDHNNAVVLKEFLQKLKK